MTAPPIPKGDKTRIAKLAAAAQALQDGTETYFSITKLTSLKSLCKNPETANHFAFYLSRRIQAKIKAASPPKYVDETDWTIYQSLIAKAVDTMGAYLESPSAGTKTALQQLRNQAQNVQNEERRVGWNTVRIVHSSEVLVIEHTLNCMLSPQIAAEYAYLAGRHYAERYDPRYGTGLIPASAPMLADIVQFWHSYYVI